MESDHIKQIVSGILLVSLLILSFLVLKPILVSIITALILTFIFSPVYDFVYKHTNSRNLSATLILLFLIFILILPIWFLTPILIKQSFEVFQLTQQIDFVTPLKSVFPSLFASEEFSAEIGSILSSFTSRAANYLVNLFSQMIINFPIILLHLTVVFFTFFFVLRDKDMFMGYVKSLLPFSKDVEKKLLDYTKGITASVLYGQVVVGIIQGIIIGIGFFIFGVPNALFLTLLASVFGILPIVGTIIVWLPIALYLFFVGSTVSAWGVLIFGLISSNIDNILRPMIISRRTEINSGIILISMIGGLFFFGVLGFILGPLVISYLLVLLEVYRRKHVPEIIKEVKGS